MVMAIGVAGRAGDRDGRAANRGRHIGRQLPASTRQHIEQFRGACSLPLLQLQGAQKRLK